MNTTRGKAKLVVFAYVIPFLAVALALWSVQQQREESRRQAEAVFSETRQTVLINCQGIEDVKTQLRHTLSEQKAAAKKQLEQFRDQPLLYATLKRQLPAQLKKQDVIIKRFKPIDCKKLPFINRGKEPFK